MQRPIKVLVSGYPGLIEPCASNLTRLEPDEDVCPKPGLAIELLGKVLATAGIEHELVFPPIVEVLLGTVDNNTGLWNGEKTLAQRALTHARHLIRIP